MKNCRFCNKKILNKNNIFCNRSCAASFNNIKNGLRCPCGTRKDKTYDCTSYFSNHIKSKTHQKWLSDLNMNKANLLKIYKIIENKNDIFVD